MDIRKNTKLAKVAEGHRQLSLKLPVVTVAMAVMLSACGSERAPVGNTPSPGNTPPPGDITAPVVVVESLAPGGFSASGYSLQISGVVTDDTAVDTVNINFGAGNVPLDLEGNFFNEEITLPFRRAEVIVTAIDTAGNQASQSVGVELSVCGSFEVSNESASANADLPASLLDISELGFWYESSQEFLLMFSDERPYAFNVATREPASFSFMDPQFVAAAGPISAAYHDSANARTLVVADDGVISLPDDGGEPSCIVSLQQMLMSASELSPYTRISASTFDESSEQLFLYYEGALTENGSYDRLVTYNLTTGSAETLEQLFGFHSGDSWSWYDVYWQLAHIAYSPVRGEAIYSLARITYTDLFTRAENTIKASSGTTLFEVDNAFGQCEIAIDNYRNRLITNRVDCPSLATSEYDLVTLLESPNPRLPERIPWRSRVSPATGKLWTIYDSSRFRVFDISDSGAVTDINPY